jgi:hypothetical protein
MFNVATLLDLGGEYAIIGVLLGGCPDRWREVGEEGRPDDADVCPLGSATVTGERATAAL